MPFANYTTVGEVAHAYQINVRRRDFVESVPVALSDHFRAELALTLGEVAYDSSKPAVCETLIYPLLREVWKSYREHLTVWSHRAIHYDADLCGVVDYVVARRSPLGPIVPDAAYLMIVEAKKDDFPRGWGHCLAAMLAVQKLSTTPGQVVYGISTNGLGWQFGLLDGDNYTQDANVYTLKDLDTLAAAISFAMSRCVQEAARQPALAGY